MRSMVFVRHSTFARAHWQSPVYIVAQRRISLDWSRSTRRALFLGPFVLAALQLSVQAQTPPFAATQQPMAITPVDARLHGAAVPNGLAGTAWFEWGTNYTFANRTSGTNIG